MADNDGLPDGWTHINPELSKLVRENRIKSGEACILVWKDGEQVDFVNYDGGLDTKVALCAMLTAAWTLIEGGSPESDEDLKSLEEFARKLGFDFEER